MRRLLGSVLPALVLAGGLTGTLAGCGDDDPIVSDQPGPTSTAPTKGPTTGEAVDFELVDLITETAAGGEVPAGAAAVPLSDDTAVQEFNAQFSSEAMATGIQEAVDQTDVPDDMLLYGSVVAIGCDAPPGVTVTSSDQGLMITGTEVANPHPECFAPMTTVALVLVPASAVS